MISMEHIVAHAKHRGFVFPGSDIYGGLANTWDYGPLGVELKNNIKRAWWQAFVHEHPTNVGLDAAILMNPKVWEASGHVGQFSDPLIDCKACKSRHRADKLIEEHYAAKGEDVVADGMTFAQMEALIAEHGIACPTCGAHDYTPIRHFQLMFQTHQGVTQSSSSVVYLRPETAQGIFVNFKHVARTMRKKLPMGIAQIGKSFRNEITPGNFTFRTREFEQMELEFFCAPGQNGAWFSYWRTYCMEWLCAYGINKDRVRMRDHAPEELSHYSLATTDIEYRFPFGWGELWGIADRSDYDLRQHMAHSGEDFQITEEGASFVPYCIEPSLGADRLALALFVDAYTEETLDEGDVRTVLRLHPLLAPVKVAVLPLSKKLGPQAQALYAQLARHTVVQYDESGSIGKRYRRQDEIGTPWCVTVDFDTEKDGAVTVRDRDTMQQERIAIADVAQWVRARLAYPVIDIHVPST
ncbi:MAG: glycine--tRNA ligase [Paenibacillaceae bacterium]|nr:glycine--tRNA ligase [Paenibacillaceae bacterium]